MKKMLLLICAVLVFACVVQAAQLRKGPYLFYPGDNSQMTVLWQLHAEPDTPEVCMLQWGLDPEDLDGSIPSTEYGEDHQHKVTIPNLISGSKYYYKVTAGEDEYFGTFLAAPAADATSLKFLAYGDTRTYPTDHNKVCAEMVEAFEADPGYQTFTLISGDFVSSGTNEEDWDIEYFGGVGPGYYYDDDGIDVDPNFYWDTTEMLANLAINGCVGNHEALSQTLFPKYWSYPFVDGFYWSFEYGPALFAVIDQYRGTRLTDKGKQQQLQWLEKLLKKSRKEWKFIVLHEPGYSAGGGHKDNLEVQELIQPLCVEYGVDIVFGGHNHYYARCIADGVQHLTLGGGGAPLREPEPDYSEYVVECAMVHHFGKIEINGNVLNFEAIDANTGLGFDWFTITHQE